MHLLGFYRVYLGQGWFNTNTELSPRTAGFKNTALSPTQPRVYRREGSRGHAVPGPRPGPSHVTAKQTQPRKYDVTSDLPAIAKLLHQ